MARKATWGGPWLGALEGRGKRTGASQPAAQGTPHQITAQVCLTLEGSPGSARPGGHERLRRDRRVTRPALPATHSVLCGAPLSRTQTCKLGGSARRASGSLPACLPARRGRGPLFNGLFSPERPQNLGSPASTTCAGEGGREGGGRTCWLSRSFGLKQGGNKHAASAAPPMALPTDAPRALDQYPEPQGHMVCPMNRPASPTKDTFSRRHQ